MYSEESRIRWGPNPTPSDAGRGIRQRKGSDAAFRHFCDHLWVGLINNHVLNGGPDPTPEKGTILGEAPPVMSPFVKIL